MAETLLSATAARIGWTTFAVASSIVLASLASCRTDPDPQAIVDGAIKAHGSRLLERAVVEFDFRGRHFTVRKDGGLFSYERAFVDSLGPVREILDNDGVRQIRGGATVAIDDAKRGSIESGINSVVYFALLPQPLNDGAVIKRYLGQSEVSGEPYHMIEITFRKEGGGKDYQDRFVYWFHTQRRTMDYFAYHYLTDETGSRLRVAVNPRTVGGVRFADYLNYTADGVGRNVEEYARHFNEDRLQLVSEVILDSLRVTPHGS